MCQILNCLTHTVNLKPFFYYYSLETANGIVAQEQGQLKSPAEKDGQPIEEVQGFFQYTANDGTPIRVQYTANENGFQPQGDHIPTPPAIPPAIQRSLDYLAAHPEPEQKS